MLNYLWGFMIVIGIVYAAVTGNLGAVSDGALDAAKDAVNLCITMLGVMSVWTGLMNIGEKSGLIGKCNRGIRPLMHWVFPDVPTDSKAMEHMTMNTIANFLGLGWAATPAGIKAMEELGKLEEERGQRDLVSREHVNKKIASDEMCTFLVMNISSLQLIPVNIIAYRSQYGSVNPTAVIGPCIMATLCSTMTALVLCKIMTRKRRR
ncbi:MAG: nucleoside recognition protein [Lachnospira sp.]|nr:nucleoside recognition protein [Lachnospira sp.]